ncbi:hypothetical protein ABZ639_21375 [Saccharomonospora sp. NPDC006951]
MRKTALAASGFALVFALSACGGEGGNNASGGSGNFFDNPQELVKAASEQTQAAKTSKYEMTMSAAGMEIKANGVGRYDGENTAMSMNMEMMGQSIEIRFVDMTMYMKVPPEAAAQMGGKEWAKIDAESAGAQGEQFDQIAQQSDPTKTLEYIQEAGEITSSEETTLDGQKATHYKIDLDFAKIADEMGTSSGMTSEQAQQLADQVGTLPMELWLNEENLPLKVTMDMGAVMEAAGAPGGESKMEMTYSDWGTEVEVEAPPADQVGEMPAF